MDQNVICNFRTWRSLPNFLYRFNFDYNLIDPFFAIDNRVRTIRSYRKQPSSPCSTGILECTYLAFPITTCVQFLLVTARPIRSSLDGILSSSPAAYLSTLGSPFNTLGNLSGYSSQPRLIQARQNEIFKRVENVLAAWGFESNGDFLQVLFYNPPVLLERKTHAVLLVD
jgi:hypothetical protein